MEDSQERDKMAKKASHVVLLSGGADSATVLGFAHQQFLAEIADGDNSKIYAFHCNYGQRTQQKELKCFNDLCKHYGIVEEDRFVIDIGYLKQIGASSLTDENIDVEKDGEALKKRYVPTSYVPFRNGNLLSIASSIASVKQAGSIWIGVVEQDSSGYPDCRVEFISFMNDAINAGLQDGHDLIIRAPIISMKKSQIIKHGIDLNVPYALTWSCYKNNDFACATCDSCRLRIKSFAELGLVDPIPYDRTWDECLDLVELIDE